MKVCYLDLESGLGLVNSVVNFFQNTHNTILENDESFSKIACKWFGINDKSKFIDIVSSSSNKFLAQNNTGLLFLI